MTVRKTKMESIIGVALCNGLSLKCYVEDDTLPDSLRCFCEDHGGGHIFRVP